MQRAIGTGIATVLTGQGAPTHRFVAPNDVHIQYYSWVCVENCIQPEYQWIRQIKEKYELTSFLKVYGGFAPDHDKTEVSIKINAPTPMIFNVADGPQSLIAVPEPDANVAHKKAEIEMSAVKCVANCQLIDGSGKSGAGAGMPNQN